MSRTSKDNQPFAEPLRRKFFGRQLQDALSSRSTPNSTVDSLSTSKLISKQMANELAKLLNGENDINESVIESWLDGVNTPSKANVAPLEKIYPNMGSCVQRNLSTPINRFLYALDIWASDPHNQQRLQAKGSVNNNPLQNDNKRSMGDITEEWSKSWAPRNEFKDSFVPRLQVHANLSSIYKSEDKPTWFRWMFLLSDTIENNTQIIDKDQVWFDWAFDLAALCLALRRHSALLDDAIGGRKSPSQSDAAINYVYSVLFVDDDANQINAKRINQLFDTQHGERLLKHLNCAQQIINQWFGSIGISRSIVHEQAYETVFGKLAESQDSIPKPVMYQPDLKLGRRTFFYQRKASSTEFEVVVLEQDGNISPLPRFDAAEHAALLSDLGMQNNPLQNDEMDPEVLSQSIACFSLGGAFYNNEQIDRLKIVLAELEPCWRKKQLSMSNLQRICFLEKDVEAVLNGKGVLVFDYS